MPQQDLQDYSDKMETIEEYKIDNVGNIEINKAKEREYHVCYSLTSQNELNYKFNVMNLESVEEAKEEIISRLIQHKKIRDGTEVVWLNQFQTPIKKLEEIKN